MAKTSNPAASAAFNATWGLIDKPDRSAAENRQMLNMAHGSRYLWQAAGGPKEWSIGDWQIARVYAILGEADMAQIYARSALELALAHAIDPFIIAAAHEGLARALALTADATGADHAAKARQMANAMADPEDAQVILDDLQQHHPDPAA